MAVPKSKIMIKKYRLKKIKEIDLKKLNLILKYKTTLLRLGVRLLLFTNEMIMLI